MTLLPSYECAKSGPAANDPIADLPNPCHSVSMIRHFAFLATAALVCPSCKNSEADNAESLVDARALASADMVSRETLYIRRGITDWCCDYLSYELRPDDTLIVEHTFSENNGLTVTKDSETVSIAPEIAEEVRWLMRRVRPTRLQGQGIEEDAVRPTGCERRGLHDFGEVSVAFMYHDHEVNVQNAKFAVFELPYASSCETRAAKEARAVVWQALEMLPQSGPASSFERAK